METRRRQRMLAVLVTCLLMAAALGRSAAAGPSERCVLAPFTLGDVPVALATGPRGIVVEWTTMGVTTLECPGRPPIGIDVWEHAMLATNDDEYAGTLNSRVRILIDFTGAGIVAFQGRMRGTGVCDGGGQCTLTMEIRAQSPGGATLWLYQSAVLDPAAGVLRVLDVGGNLRF